MRAPSSKKRYVVILMERQGDGEPGWIEDSEEFETQELAEAASIGANLVMRGYVPYYVRIFDRAARRFVDSRAADAEYNALHGLDVVFVAAEAAELADVQSQFGSCQTRQEG